MQDEPLYMMKPSEPVMAMRWLVSNDNFQQLSFLMITPNLNNGSFWTVQVNSMFNSTRIECLKDLGTAFRDNVFFKENTALAKVAKEFIKTWCGKNSLPFKDFDDSLTKDEAVSILMDFRLESPDRKISLDDVINLINRIKL